LTALLPGYGYDQEKEAQGISATYGGKGEAITKEETTPYDISSYLLR